MLYPLSYGGKRGLPTQPSALRLSLVTPQELAAQLARILTEIIDQRRPSDGACASEHAQTPIEVTEADAQPERPKNREHGDWASNLAMKFAKRLGMNPRELASE